MREDFDPYYVWLGIPPREQPPDHYRLLGITQFESDADVIRNAAEQRMRYLRTVTGPRARRAQQLVNEIVAAQRILSEDTSREKYNALITESPLAKRRGVSPPAVSTPGFEPPAIDTPSYRRRTRHTRNSEGDDPRRVQVKIMAALIPGVVVVVIGIIWMLAGGDSSSKQGARNDRENKTGSEASPGQGVEKDSLEAARNKNFGNQAENTAAKRPPKPVVKPPKPESGPENSGLDKPSEPLAPAPTEEPDDEQSTLEQAEVLLKSKGLEEGFNGEWKLANAQTRNLQQIQASSGYSGMAEGPQYKRELKRRLVKQKTQILNRWIHLGQHPADNGGPRDREYNALASWIYPTGLGPMVKEDMPVLVSIRKQVRDEFAARAAANPAMLGLIIDIRNQYAALAKDPEVTEMLQRVGGTLANPPALPTTRSPLPSQSIPASAANEKSEIADSYSFAELKDQLTALEKETKLSMGAFNKGAKEYIKQKKDLVKRIKAGEALYARRAKIQDGIQYPEDKTKFGQETDAKVTKPLQALKVQLQKLSKPDAAAMEDNLSRAEKLLAQIKATPEYAANQKSIDGRAENIAKYHKGFNVQQVKMAK